MVWGLARVFLRNPIVCLKPGRFQTHIEYTGGTGPKPVKRDGSIRFEYVK